MEEFSGKLVLVTGAGGNLGSAVAAAFMRRGAALALVDRDPDRLANAFPTLPPDSPHLVFGGPDLTSTKDVDELLSRIGAASGPIDILVNTVGGYRAGNLIEDTDPETWEYMLDLNARTTFLMSRAVIPGMKEKGSGSIINISALAALTGKAKMAAYIVSKAAVIRLTESMAEELRPFNINVNVILPRNIDTPENRAESPDADFSKWVTPDAIAEVIVFLASAAGRPIHGASIPVRGSG
jgi:NAD(P)-dependent dehydrogenase (short-subunit alcohol dehydrogenase family)